MKVRSGIAWLLLLLVGCTHPNSPTRPAPNPPAVMATPESARADETVGAEVRRRLTVSGNDLIGVIISVSNGVVTLGGSVSNPAAALRAEAAVRGVNGVKSVRNELLIRGGY